MGEVLLMLAKRYIWWKTPQEAILFRERLSAQVMNIGSYEDVLLLEDKMGKEALAKVVKSAEAGWFTPKSWHFWNYRLGLCGIGDVPPMPRRNIPEN